MKKKTAVSLNHAWLRINVRTHPLLTEHVFNLEPIMLSAGFIELALKFGACTLMDVVFLPALPLSMEVPATVEVGLNRARGHVEMFGAGTRGG
ncbi:hypothetical protein JB92DRAFT_3105429 [Gautieria morchelliformis]|nr:hypothetical protein JB92DRAFT_3105429 [Gautieria morchelliformis]